MKSKPNDYFLKQYPDLLNTKEVGEILRISTKTVCKMIHEGEIKAFSVARKTLVPKVYLLQYIYGKDAPKIDDLVKIYGGEK